ncbi:SDR family NAD(P)-dependent oxidoreductase [Croceicoccus sp. YJ47]|uniref:SDR family NAD(P)-dependent oxidoreductase n=1 Tax=Croceicoccus sp. YJ47 TaxID=2798724 RepID=UPI001923C39F|nr:SDR family oxidoreductase [Croceicoccus sp. YJ47]QQN75263.1 SDR family oxidoreductase [Croceicoccus sp. YJ47]
MSSENARRILVTGAGRGIGREIALGFAAEGAEIILAARSSDELETTCADVVRRGGSGHVVPTDLNDPQDIEALAEKALARGNIDVLVCNAAFSPVPQSLLDARPDDWLKTMTVNVAATLRLVQRLAPGMTGRDGANIIVVSSIRGLGGTPSGGLYGSSKAALNHMIKTLACELGPQGIRVNGILPGPVLTRMTTDFLPDNEALFEFYGDIAPIKGWTMPDDMVAPALFLASAGARKVSGHLLVVDGGLSAINADAIAPPAALLG